MAVTNVTDEDGTFQEEKGSFVPWQGLLPQRGVVADAWGHENALAGRAGAHPASAKPWGLGGKRGEEDTLAILPASS